MMVVLCSSSLFFRFCWAKNGRRRRRERRERLRTVKMTKEESKSWEGMATLFFVCLGKQSSKKQKRRKKNKRSRGAAAGAHVSCTWLLSEKGARFGYILNQARPKKKEREQKEGGGVVWAQFWVSDLGRWARLCFLLLSSLDPASLFNQLFIFPLLFLISTK